MNGDDPLWFHHLIHGGPSLSEIWKTRDWGHDCAERGCLLAKTGLDSVTKSDSEGSKQSG